jgi:osmotically inducible protein OsmC
MTVRTASAVWEGGLVKGNGTFNVQSGAVSGEYSFPTRFEDKPGTNPEELIGAAHAACFSMAFSAGLEAAGFTPTSVSTTAKVHLEKGADGFGIPKIELITEAVVPGIDEATFQEQAQASKVGCPVSKLLTGAEITLSATLAG